MTDDLMQHEKLQAYQKALEFANWWLPVVDGWNRSLAVPDQLSRAIESMLTNLAKANRNRESPLGVYDLECSLGSVYECAACLDVGCLRGTMAEPELRRGKKMLQPIARMEIKLRLSWIDSIQGVAEGPATYRIGDRAASPKYYFPHESLEAYQLGLAAFKWAGANLLAHKRLPAKYARKIDQSATSMVLNVAEGNGRFSPDDHRTFIDNAKQAATSFGVYLELSAAKLQIDVGSPLDLIRMALGKLEGLGTYLNR